MSQKYMVYITSAEVSDHTTASPIETQQSHACSTQASESSTTCGSIHSPSISPPLSEGFQKPPFECGCGKCTLSSFIERGCPMPFSSKDTFLKLGQLTDEQQEDFRERLAFESQRMMMHFQTLVSKTMESLIRQNVSFDRLVAHIMTLGAFDPVYIKPQLPLFQDRHNELKAADTIPKIFLVINGYISFFNYDIIEHIINVLGTDEDKVNLQSYKNKFDRYVRQRIYQCGPHLESETDHSIIFVKLDSRYDNYTGAEIKRFCRKLSETLHVSSKGVMRLCEVHEGCIQLTFQVPSFVQQKIFPLSKEQEKALAAMGVMKLTCGEYQFLVRLSGSTCQCIVSVHVYCRFGMRCGSWG